jgi:regulator of sigma E protease
MDIVWLLPAVPLFLLVISLVITVHELGHYCLGRMFGAAVESFSLGFGRSILEKRDSRGTRWRLNWIPLGGFVKFVGEVQLAQDLNQEIPETVATEAQALEARGKTTILHENQILVGKPYTHLNPWQRIAVSLGGPFANFIFAALIFAIMGFAFGVSQSKQVQVTEVIAGGPAELAGFKAQDIIVKVAGRPVTSSMDVTSVTSLSAREPVEFNIRRGTDNLSLTVTPVEKEEIDPALNTRQKIGRIGMGLTQVDTSLRRLNPIEALGYGVSRTGEALGQTFNVVRRLVTGKEGIDKLSGPVGILHLTGGVTQMTMKQEGVDLGRKLGDLALVLVQLAALLSVGIGFFNLLPLPILDGGAVVMTLAEAATGKPLPDKVQNAGLTIGLVCLVTFALVVTLQDTLRLPIGLPWGS